MPFEDHEYPQVIPTPPYAVPGGPAPWHEVDSDRRHDLTRALVVSRLRDAGRTFDVATYPSEAAELSDVVADDERRLITRRSAVLVVLFEEAGETRVILTRRSLDLKNHRGEVAFPGGRCDEDESFEDTALREAEEEIGLPRSLVTIDGWLSPIVTFASGSAIQPIVGWLDRRPEVRANPGEVDRIFDVALRDLVADGNFLEQRWRREVPRPGADADGSFPIFFFRVPGEVVWGATGRILTELCALAVGAPWPGGRWVLG